MNYATRTAPLALALAAAIAIPVAQAQQPQPQERGAAPVKAAPQAALKVSFATADVTRIKEFYKAQGASSPASPPKKDGKPAAGQPKPIAKGDTLSAGLGKKSLPRDLEGRLAPIPEGYARFVIGADVVLVDPRQVVLDIVPGVAI